MHCSETSSEFSAKQRTHTFKNYTTTRQTWLRRAVQSFELADVMTADRRPRFIGDAHLSVKVATPLKMYRFNML